MYDIMMIEQGLYNHHTVKYCQLKIDIIAIVIDSNDFMNTDIVILQTQTYLAYMYHATVWICIFPLTFTTYYSTSKLFVYHTFVGKMIVYTYYKRKRYKWCNMYTYIADTHPLLKKLEILEASCILSVTIQKCTIN